MTLFHKLSAYLLMASAVLGLLLAAGGIWLLTARGPAFAARLSATADEMDILLGSTIDMLNGLDVAFQEADTNIDHLDSAVAALQGSLDVTVNTVNEIAGLVNNEMKPAVASIEDSLGTLATTAKLVDGTLRVVSVIPFIGSSYAPEVSLEESVKGVESSLKDLPDTLDRVQSNLVTGAGTLVTVKGEISILKTGILDLKMRVADTRKLVGDMRTSLGKLQQQLAVLRQNLPGQLRLTGWVLGGILAWLLILQPGLFATALDMRKRA
jgi:prefoldin subunit 5